MHDCYVLKDFLSFLFFTSEGVLKDANSLRYTRKYFSSVYITISLRSGVHGGFLLDILDLSEGSQASLEEEPQTLWI